MARDHEKQIGPGFLGRLFSRSDRRAGAANAGGDPFDTPEKAYAEAERRIEHARKSGATELVLGFRYGTAEEPALQRLEKLPPSIAGLTALRSLTLHNTQVTDLAPIAGLTTLQTLDLARTRVADLAPIAGLTSLSSAAQADSKPIMMGVRFGATPVSQNLPFDALVWLKQPASTVETINTLRRQQGLPEFFPEGYVRPEGFVPPEVAPPQPPVDQLPDPGRIPQQAPTGLQFGGAETGPIGLVTPAGETPEDNAAQREFYAEIKDKAGALIEACGNSNRLGRTRQIAQRLLATMGQELPELQERLFWSRMNTLRRASENDRRAREASDPETPAMPEEVAVHLDDLVDTLNVFASGDARLVEIDHQSIDPALRIATEELAKAAREIAEAARGETKVIDREAAEVLAEVAADSEGQSPSADRAREFSVRSSRNLALELIRRAYRVVRAGAQKGSGWAAGAIAGSVIGGIGGAQFVDFIARHEPLIRGIIRDLPAQETLTTILNLILRLAP